MNPTRHQHGGPAVSMNMTPLIDVVFLLIIFFLVSSHLARQETQSELNLPVAETGDAGDSAAHERIVLNLSAEGRLLLSGQPIPLNKLTQALKYEVEKSARPLEVRLRADRAIAYGQVEPVLVACARAGVWDVRLAVRGEGA